MSIRLPKKLLLGEENTPKHITRFQLSINLEAIYGHYCTVWMA